MCRSMHAELALDLIGMADASRTAEPADVGELSRSGLDGRARARLDQVRSTFVCFSTEAGPHTDADLHIRVDEPIAAR
jgi:hypothetical protein